MPTLATNSNVTLTVTVRNIAGAPVDPSTIELVWKLGRYGDVTTVPQASLTNDGTGVYSATVNPQESSNNIDLWFRRWFGRTVLLYYEFRMTNPNYVERGKVALSTSEFCR